MSNYSDLFGGGNRQFLITDTLLSASTVSAVDFTNIDTATYRSFEMEIIGLKAATTHYPQIMMGVNGTSYVATQFTQVLTHNNATMNASYYAGNGYFIGNNTLSANELYYGKMAFFALESSTLKSFVNFQGGNANNNNHALGMMAFNARAENSIRFSGSFNGGRIKLWGRK